MDSRKRKKGRPYVAQVVGFGGGRLWCFRGIGGNGKTVIATETRTRRYDRDIAARALAKQLGVPYKART